jgi:hypothetical protein
MPDHSQEQTQPKHSGASLRARRCVRHEQREAVARCPLCGGYFCRECVSEHEARLLCADCLSREVASRQVVQRPRRQLPPWVGQAVVAGLGFALLWFLFFLGANLLLRIPPDFHSGEIFKFNEQEVAP